MSISSITRDWGIVPCIVRIVSSDSLAVVSSSGYISAQEDNINLANNGDFEWLASDSVLVYASNGSSFFTISSDFSSLVPEVVGSQNAITAHSGGGQANAVQLSAQINRVTVVAVAADSVKLPSAKAGVWVVVINDGANSLNIFPATGEQIDALGANAAYALAAGKRVAMYCAVNGEWSALLGA